MTQDLPPFDLATVLNRANQATLILAESKSQQRNQVLQHLFEALKIQQNEILEANTLDLELSREMAVSDIVLGWLKLTPERLQAMMRLLQQLIALPDPLERMAMNSFRTEKYQAYSQPSPLGVIAFIFEACPTLAILAAAMAIKTGNVLLLRGTSEALQSNQAIADILVASVEAAGLPRGCIDLLPVEGLPLKDILNQEQWLDLVIPYGRPSLVQQVVRQSNIPVLRTVSGNCHLFWAASGGAEAVRSIIVDSHQGEPDAVNAIEKVLIHRRLNPALLVLLFNNLREKGFELRGDPELVATFPDLVPAEAGEWRHPYLKKIVAFRYVDDLDVAIAWINQNSSCHADCIVTESYPESRQFIRSIDSASTYINASPRFLHSVGNIPGGVSLGMSNQKGYHRGVIGLQSLMTAKTVIQGDEEIKA